MDTVEGAGNLRKLVVTQPLIFDMNKAGLENIRIMLNSTTIFVKHVHTYIYTYTGRVEKHVYLLDFK